MFPKSIESGASQSARNSSPTCTMISEIVLSTPPAATADVRSRPWRWRKRICIVTSAATGTARFENDIDDCSRIAGHSATRIGTVPRNATANAASVSMPEREREQHVLPARVAHRVPELPGSPIRLSRKPTATSAATAMMIERGCTR